MKVTAEGIDFNYNNDVVTWLWPWNRSYKRKFQSLIYDTEFKSLKDYWIHVGQQDRPDSYKRVKGKVSGFPLKEAIEDWIKFNLRTGCHVVLWDINLDAKPASFWRTIPEHLRIQFTSDIVVLSCKDHQEASNLCTVIETSFANACAVSGGDVIGWNTYK